MKYTLKTLAENNQLFDSQYGVNQSDVEKINHLVSLIESRQGNILQIGDVVEYTNEYGEYFQTAAIDNIEEKSVHICENAGINIGEGSNGLSYSLSGGSFNHVSIDNFTYLGKTEKEFWTFGHCGACANGGIYFKATVNLWECNINKELYSTKTHDKFYLSYRESKNGDYQYFASKNGMSSCAWKTNEEMQAWLRTKRAIITGKNTWGSGIIWTYKEVKHGISNTEFDALKAKEDIFLMNGSKRRCKRVYDDEKYILHTYFVWYWEDASLDFYTRMDIQNKIIDSYEVDYFTNEVNKIALEELRNGKVKPLEINFN